MPHARTHPSIAAALALCLPLATAAAAAAEPSTWTPMAVHVSAIDTARGGNLEILVFGPDGFPTKHDQALKRVIVPVKTAKMTVTVEIPKGSPFALKVLHDQDENGKLTKNWLGILPVEGLGFSSGAKLDPMPPDFEDARMEAPQGKTETSIEMVYP